MPNRIGRRPSNGDRRLAGQAQRRLMRSPMEIRSQESLKQIGPAPAPPPRQAERLHSRGLLPPRVSNHPLPPELQIAADAGVPLEQVMATTAGAPADVSPLQALLAAGVIGEERYYQALAKKLGCAYYLGSPHLAEDFNTARGLRCGVAPLAASHGRNARAVIAPRAADTSRLIEMASSGRLHPESFAVTSPQRF